MQSFLTFLGGTGTEYWPKMSRNSPPEVFLGKDVLKVCSKFTREQPCRRMISIKLQSTFLYEHLWKAASEWVKQANICQG